MAEKRIAQEVQEAVRIDRWLCAARIFKSRTAATEACGAGRVSINGQAVRASHLLRIGDRVEGRAPRGQVVLEVLGLAETRLSPKLARALYQDHSPPPPPPEERFPRRTRGLGRPTKSERRILQKFRDDFY
jgi:ribosome-associated heat shock protein Hsp15